MPAQQYDILIPGNYSCNFIMNDLPDFPELGKEIYAKNFAMVPGGVMNTVIALKRLRLNVGWLGVVGKDFFSRSMLEWAESENVDTSLVVRQDRLLRILTVALSYHKDRALVSYTDPAPGVMTLLLDHLKGVSFLAIHFGELVIDERLPALLREYKKRGVLISSDCQYHEEMLDFPLVREILSLVDIFIPNKTEVKLLTGEDELDAGAKKLAEIVPLLIVKDGKNGSHAWQQETHHFEASIPLDPVDTTGAGDVFNAGFLASHLAGHSLPTSLRWGNIAGAMATQGFGGATNAPSRDDIERQLAETPS